MKQAATLFLSFLLMAPWSCILGAQVSANEPPKAPKTAENLPEQNLYQLLAAEMALDREHPEIALANYIAAAKETQDPSIAQRATQIALSVASLDVAIVPSAIWAKAAPKNLEAQITTAALYIRLGQPEKAIDYLQRSAEIDPDEALQYYLVLYKQLQKEDDSQRVIKALEMLSAKDTKQPSAALALAEIYLFLGKNNDGLKMAEKALKIKKDSIVGIELMTEALIRTQNKTVAKEFLDKQIRIIHDNELTQYYAQFLFDNGYQKQAKQEIEQLIKDPKLTSEELLNFARLCMQAQWYDLADGLLHRSSKSEKSKDLSYYFLARLNEMQNKDDAAIDWFKKVSAGPFHVLSQIRASVLLTEKKRYDDAISILNEAQPNDLGDKKQLLLATADVLSKATRNEEALKLLDDNMEEFGDDVELHYARSLVADKLDKIVLAEADLKAILQTQPNHLDALNALGYILANKTKRYDEAQQYLNRALTLSPNNAQVLDSLGWLYYKMGNYSKSLENLKKAAEITPDAEIAAHLGEVMWQMKDYEGAKKVWSEALQNYPTHENVINVMRKMMLQKK